MHDALTRADLNTWLLDQAKPLLLDSKGHLALPETLLPFSLPKGIEYMQKVCLLKRGYGIPKPFSLAECRFLGTKPDQVMRHLCGCNSKL